MSRAALGDHLADLETGLENLLACFEAEPLPALEAMNSSWTHVLRAFEGVHAELHRGERSGHVEALERCQRLYAVATALLARRRDEVAAERAACADARTRLRRVRSEGASGESCDVRG